MRVALVARALPAPHANTTADARGLDGCTSTMLVVYIYPLHAVSYTPVGWVQNLDLASRGVQCPRAHAFDT